MNVLLPLGLLAFAALAIPLAIHLLRKPEDRIVPFAAWRFLSRDRLPRERLRIWQWWLLALRLLLIATLALLVSMPVRRADAHPEAQWVVVSPQLSASAAHAALNRPNAEWHWLQAGFDSLDKVPASTVTVDLGLLRELDAQLAPNDKLAVIVPERLSGLDAIRPELSREVEWVVVASASVDTSQSPLVAVRHDNESATELATIEALRAAWNAVGKPIDFDIAAQARSFDARAQLLIWLGGEPSAEALRWVADGGTLLRTRATAGAWPLSAVATGQGRIYSMSSALSPEATPGVGESNFATQLRELLRPARAPGSADARSFKPARAALTPIERRVPLDAWFTWIALCLFVAERICAARLARRAHG